MVAAVATLKSPTSRYLPALTLNRAARGSGTVSYKNFLNLIYIFKNFSSLIFSGEKRHCEELLGDNHNRLQNKKYHIFRTISHSGV